MNRTEHQLNLSRIEFVVASGIKIDYVSQSKCAIYVHVVYKHVRGGGGGGGRKKTGFQRFYLYLFVVRIGTI
jgi:hypothetical protein